jgi:integrase
MRGSIVKRSKTSWSLVIDQGRDPNGRRKQKWIRFEISPALSVRKNTKAAQAKLAELLHQLDQGTYVDASKLTLIEYLRAWLEKSVKPMRRPETHRVYQSVIEKHVAISTIATIPLQRLRTSDLESYYATLKAAPATVAVHRAVLHRALKMAARDRLITVNPATHVERPSRPKRADRARADELLVGGRGTAILAVAATAPPQLAAFCFLALDTGARKSELHGLVDGHRSRCRDLFQSSGSWTRPGRSPRTDQPRRAGHARSRSTGDDRTTRRAPEGAERTRMKTGPRTPTSGCLRRRSRIPASGDAARAAVEHAQRGALSEARRGRRRAENYRPRPAHTSATLLLGAGVPVHVAAARLGHRDGTVTLSTYAHSLPNLQQDAAARLGQLLHG